jgi:hypothetical protein
VTRMTVSWPLVAVVGAVGLGSGTVGAIVYARIHKPAPPIPVAAAGEGPQHAPIVPPGWNLALVSRLASVEQKVDELRAPAAVPSASIGASADPTAKERQEERERQRAADYQKELDYREKALTEHASEPSDQSWAAPQAASMEQSIKTAFEGSARAATVDCRTKTCVATLTFPSPSDALVSMGQRAQKLAVEGCQGFVAIPTPPTSDGPYDMKVMYNCR